MSSHHPSEPSSAASTPRSEHHLPPPPHRWQYHPYYHHDGGGAGEEEEEDPGPGPRVRLMCSFGGRILPRPHDHQLRYVGGETRIVAVPRAASLAALLAKFAKLLHGAVQIKYQLPHEDLDALISVTSDEDVEIMMEEHERLAAVSGGAAARTPRLRLFLFPTAGGDTGGFGSLQDCGDDTGSRRERWFLDALNSRAGAAATLERGRSEASSVVSELPDYLFGLDSNSDQTEPVQRAAHDRSDPLHRATNFPESPVRRALYEPPPETPIPDFLQLKAKPPGPPSPSPPISQDMTIDEPVQQAAAAGYPGSRTWQYMTEQVPVYFVPSSVPPQRAGSVPIPFPLSYGSHPGNPAPVPVVYQHPVQGFNSNPMGAGPVYVGGMPVSRPGPVVGPYGLPTMVHAPLGGPGAVVSINPTAGVIPREELPDGRELGGAKYHLNV